MVRGYKDFTLPVTIEAVTIETLPVNITAQAIESLAVTIKGSTVTIPVHEIGTANVAIQSSVTLNMNIVGVQTSIPVTNVAGQNLNVAIQSSVTLNMNITGAAVTVPVTTPAGAHVDVDIISSVTLNVNISQCAVTLNVNIVSQSVDINIKTSGGANIVIDKLTQGAYTERRFRMENNGESATMIGNNLTYKKAKFFTRGARGYIGSVEVYCDNLDTVAHVLTLKISPQPGMAPIHTRSLTVPAGASADWRMVLFGVFWNYDSLFIWVSSDSDSYGRIGYDTGEPRDGYVSSDEVLWSPLAMRFWIRVSVLGGTVGDIPVSGTINTIEVLASTCDAESGWQSVPNASETTLVSVTGSGTILELMVHFGTSTPPSSAVSYVIRPYVDGELVGIWNEADLTGSFGATSGKTTIGQFYQYSGNTKMFLWLPFKFRRSFELRVYQTTGGVVSTFGRVVYNKQV